MSSGPEPRLRRRGLDRLTPAGALSYFVWALVAGVGCIALSGRLPALAWWSVAPIVLYGWALARAQRRYHVALNGTVKDSPYFLGFLLTMLALAKVFLDVGAAGMEKIPVGQVVGDASAALLATVVGLFLRQVLHSLDHEENLRDAVFQSALAQLRESAVALHESQQAYLGLHEEFVSERRKLFQREETALDAYLERLQAGAEALGALHATYPAGVRALLEALGESVDRGRRAAEDAVQALAGSTRSLAAAQDGLRARVAEVTRETGTVVELADAAARLRTTLVTLEQTAAASARAIDETSKALARDATATGEGVERRAEALERELRAIDGVLEEFVTVLRARIARMGELEAVP